MPKNKEYKDELKIFLNQFNHCKDWRKAIYDKKWKDYLNVYKAVREEKPYPYKSNIVLAVVWELVENFLAKMCYSMPVFDAESTTEEGMEHADNIKDVLSYQWHEAKVYKQLVAFIKQSLIFGTSVGEVVWKKDVREVNPRIKNEHGVYEFADFTEKRIIFDNPLFRTLDLFRFYGQPKAADLQQMRYCFVQSIAYYGDLKNNPYYINVNKVQPKKYLEIDKTENQSILGLDTDDIPPDDVPADMKVELLTRYGKDEMGNETIMIVANRDVVVKEPQKTYFRHGKKPLISIQDYTNEYQFYGQGEAERLEPLQYMISDIYNLLMDNLNISTNQMWAMDESAGIDEDLLIAQPGLLLKGMGKPTDWLMPVPTQPISGDIFKFVDNIRDEIRNLPGNTLAFSGVPSPSLHRTKGGLQKLYEQAAVRLMMKQKMLEDGAVRQIAEFFLELNQQNILENREIYFQSPTGLSYKTISPEIFNYKYNIKVVPKSMQAVDEEAETKKAEFLLRTLWNVAAPYNLNLLPLIKNFLDSAKFHKTQEVIGSQDIIAEPRPEAEHWMMLQGIPIPPRPTENFQQHLNRHNGLINSQMFKNLPPQTQQILQQHLIATQQLLQQIQMQQKTAEGMMPSQKTEQAMGTETRVK